MRRSTVIGVDTVAEVRLARFSLRGGTVLKESIKAIFGGFTQGQEFKVIAQRRFANTTKGYQELVKWMEKKRKDWFIPCRASSF